MVAAKLTGHRVNVDAVAWSPDGEWLVTGGRESWLLLWDHAGTPVLCLVDHDGWILRLAWSPDGGLIASAHGDGAIRLWTRDDKAPVRRIAAHELAVEALSWSADATTGDLASTLAPS